VSITFKVDGLKSWIHDFESMPEKIRRNVRKVQKTLLWDIARSAGRNHRYTARSGRLDAAYSGNPEGPPGSRLKTVQTRTLTETEIFLTTTSSQTPYAHRIHEGFFSWSPDRFVDAAVRRLKGPAEAIMKAAVLKGISDSKL